MVDVTAKADTQRERSPGLVRMKPETLALIQKGKVPKETC